ncbi:MAG: hypothetical protein WCR19_02115 [Acholeplasmataceae bacterium]
MKKIFLLTFLVFLIILVGCSKTNPHSDDYENHLNVDDYVLYYDYNLVFLKTYYEDDFTIDDMEVWFYEYECTINGFIDAYEISFYVISDYDTINGNYKSVVTFEGELGPDNIRKKIDDFEYTYTLRLMYINDEPETVDISILNYTIDEIYSLDYEQI